MTTPEIDTIFTDIGGVLLTNGWDHTAREKAAALFKLDAKITDDRHHTCFDTYETGKMSLDAYLDYTVFYEPRTFSKKKFIQFMYSCSQPYEDMLALYRKIKKKYGVKIAVVSNEGRELNEYRFKTFKLGSFVDFFISSSYVHLRKPDKDIFKLAIDIAQCDLQKSIYIDDRMLFVQAAASLGLKGIYHKDYEDTRKRLGRLGLIV